jgi:gluconokinase/shikimate kinase
LVLVLMGVSGSGKTTVAAALARRLGWAFQEGDALHPRANVAKMEAGEPLTDDVRRPWLEAVARWIDARLDAGENALITCSALKRSYRDMLDKRGHGVVFAFLSGPQGMIAARLAKRHGHFMPASLLDSQFADLEPPGPDEPALTVDAARPPNVIADEIVRRLRLTGG